MILNNMKTTRTNSVIYLASPYSHPALAVRDRRLRAACGVAASLVQIGVAAFSPVVHSHPLVEFGLPTDWSFWQRLDGEMLARCDEVVVLMLDGWRESEGVQAEIAIARALGKSIRFMEPAPVETPAWRTRRRRRNHDHETPQGQFGAAPVVTAAKKILRFGVAQRRRHERAARRGPRPGADHRQNQPPQRCSHQATGGRKESASIEATR
jgi:nucleoside 2-deoxyribosyltransferase